MEVFHIKRDIPFMRYAGITSVFSAATFFAAVIALFVYGLHFSVDFTGGTVMELNYPQAVETMALRDTLAKNGYKDASVQKFATPGVCMER